MLKDCPFILDWRPPLKIVVILKLNRQQSGEEKASFWWELGLLSQSSAGALKNIIIRYTKKPERGPLMKIDIFQWVTKAYSENENPSSPNRSRTYDLPITSSDALPLSYRRLVGVKAIKLGSWDKHPADTARMLSDLQIKRARLTNPRSPISTRSVQLPWKKPF